MGVVYICHHIDTEGPLWENIEELFNRLKLIFGISIAPTYANLELLQKGQIAIDEDKKRELMIAIDPHTIGFNRNWGMIEKMLFHIMSEDYRNQLKDSFGGGWIYNWHVMDHVGFGTENPRHRDIGYHNIFNFYKYMIDVTDSFQDRIHWHFHPIPFYKQAHIPATCYDNCLPVLHEIICKRLIDKNWFPVVNRAGFHTERIDSNLFLEQWMPFDPSNQSTDDESLPKFQKDLINGRYGDWRGAPSDWSLYHPDFYDWRKKGSENRIIARILNLNSRHRSISEKEIEKAFMKASNGENVYLGITNHDWRDMSVEIDSFRTMLDNVCKRYPEVKFKFSESIDAFRNVIGYSDDEININKLKLSAEINDNILIVDVLNGKLFGPQPYLSIKTKGGAYFHDNFDFLSENRFSYALDEYTIPLENIDCIVVASNDKYGNTEIVRVNMSQSITAM